MRRALLLLLFFPPFIVSQIAVASDQDGCLADRVDTTTCSFSQQKHEKAPHTVDVIHVADFGTKCDGVSDDTNAIRAAAASVPAWGATLKFPKGVCVTHGTIYLKSHTHVTGDGTTLLASEVWTPDHTHGYAFLENVHYNATTVTDTDISVSKMIFDYGTLGPFATPGGGKHAIRFEFVRHVLIEQNLFFLRGAEDAVAGLGVDNMSVRGNSAYEFRNCAYDFWTEPSNVTVTGNYAETTKSAQMVNFNPERTSGNSEGAVARGFLMSQNTLVVTGMQAVGILIEPLGPGTAVVDVSIHENRIHNSYLVLRGDVRKANITDNIITYVSGGASAFETYPHWGESETLLFSPITS